MIFFCFFICPDMSNWLSNVFLVSICWKLKQLIKIFCFVGAINIIQVYEKKNWFASKKLNKNNQIETKKTRWPTLLRLKVVFYKKKITQFNFH